MLRRVADQVEAVIDRDAIIRAVELLAPRQREVVVPQRRHPRRGLLHQASQPPLGDHWPLSHLHVASFNDCMRETKDVFLTRDHVVKYNGRAMEAARTYTSPLRADQVVQTRLRILRAVTEVLADPASEEVTIPLVARRARVSLRTVYRHFPTREALFDAWADWAEQTLRIPLYSYPESAGRLSEFARELYRSYEENGPLVRAMLSSTAGRAVRERSRRRRQRAFKRSMLELTDGLDEKQRMRALAVVYLLVSAPAWQAMREQWGLDGVESGKAAAWAVRVLTDEVRRNPESIKEADDDGGHRR
jgi:AcrR family transcriptional regulator